VGRIGRSRFLGTILESDSLHLAAAQQAVRSRPAFAPALPRLLAPEDSGAKLDAFLGVPGFDDAPAATTTAFRR
jgi:hypothetical protein